jgi:IS5 family transposase
MIRHEDPNQQRLPGFEKFFGIPLDKQNRWVKLGEIIPWDEFAKAYYKNMSSGMGRPAKPARLVIGAVIIKHKLCLSDEETIDQIRENPYLQYFVGLTTFQTKAPFAPSLFVEIRRRMGDEVFEQFNQSIIDRLEGKTTITEDESDDEQAPPNQGDNSESGEKPEPPVNKGKLIVDATVAEQAIHFPTDLGLLNKAREISETLIDTLYPLSGLKKKPRTYRRKARKAYLGLAKQKSPQNKQRRKGIKQQLQFLRRNFGHIENLLDLVADESTALTERQRRQYWVIQEVYRQQEEMFRQKSRRCDHRIVNIHQPHIRPIVRGKAGKKVEFGAKLGVSLTADALAQVDHLSWESYHEGHDLPSQVENYKQRHGHYPEVVLADQIYGSRENRRYLRNRNIRFAGKALGRPKKETDENKLQIRKEKRRRKAEYQERIPVEGKFGQGKNGYRLNYIRARTEATSEAWIRSIFLVMNLLVLASSFLRPLKTGFLNSYSFIKELFIRSELASKSAELPAAIFQLRTAGLKT